jgi:ergothioneine biosynthesis protein EgtB
MPLREPVCAAICFSNGELPTGGLRVAKSGIPLRRLRKIIDISTLARNCAPGRAITVATAYCASYRSCEAGKEGRLLARDPQTAPPAPKPGVANLADRLFQTRARSMELASPLSAEDMVVQSMDDASPTKWHLAHTTWFFENFLLRPQLGGYRLFDETFNYCFNSYYESQGPRQPRPHRGLLTRPSAERVFAYRAHVDEALKQLLNDRGADDPVIAEFIEIGINHEQQHQELLLTDILALFATNPLRPAYQAMPSGIDQAPPEPLSWRDFAGGIERVGHSGPEFCWDNERPYHEALLRPFRLSDRLVTNADWLAFMEDGGYSTASLWLSDGWATINRESWKSPLYWEELDAGWFQMSLQGLLPVSPAEPVTHVSYYEADAFARWAGKRLPTEFEWEVASSTLEGEDIGAANPSLRPRRARSRSTKAPQQLFGEVWQWTASAYLPYPGYRPPEGAIGEYNGKFMVSQHVLRGSSCVTPEGHTRRTYRNFFYPHQRWQFTGLRLASEIE